MFKPSSVDGNTPKSKTNPVEDLGSKLKALKELPRKKIFTFLQTVCQNMKSFTKQSRTKKEWCVFNRAK